MSTVIKGAPHLLIEILTHSSRTRDKTSKFKQYSPYNVREYWIVDPEKKQIDVFDLEKQKLIPKFLKRNLGNPKKQTPNYK